MRLLNARMAFDFLSLFMTGENMNNSKRNLVLSINALLVSTMVFSTPPYHDTISNDEGENKGIFTKTYLTIADSTNSTQTEKLPFVDDKTITTLIQNKINSNPRLKKSKIYIHTQQGVVKITGFVHSDTEEDLVYKIAESTAGVKDVIGSYDPTRDSLITAKVEGLLIRHNLVDETNGNTSLKVLTNNGTVTLTGKTLNQTEKGKIIALLHSIGGVVNVVFN